MKGRHIRINRIPAAIVAVFIICLLVYYLNFYSNEQPALYALVRSQEYVNLRKLLIASVQAAQLGGLEIVSVARSRNLSAISKGKTDEGANDPFTAADGRSHCVMKHGLHRIFPRLTIVSEEDKHRCLNANTFDLDPTVLHESADIPDALVNTKDVRVWIDPLDATQEFTEQLYEYVTTMVCVAINGQPKIGVIHCPFSGRTVWAWVDSLMSENLNIATHREHSDNTLPIITISRSHAGDVKTLIKSVFGENATILNAAGAGYKVLQLIAKNATAYLHTTKIKKWDICAGDAILQALGGTMTTLEKERIDYSTENSPLNTHGLLATLSNHDEYLQKLIGFKNNGSESVR